MSLQKLFQLLDPSEKKRFFFIATVLIISSLIETLGLTSIMPFVYLASNPELTIENKILNIIYLESNNFGVSTHEQFIIFFGLFVFFFLIFSLSIRAFTQYIINRFSYMRESSIGVRLIKNYLSQPYIWFIDKNSSDLTKNILSNVSIIIQHTILPVMTLIANTVLALSLIGLLVFVDPMPAITIGGTLLFSYIIIFFFLKKIIKRLGQKSVKANQNRFLTVSNSFQLIKELKINNLEKLHIDLFEKASLIFAKTNSFAVIAGQLPRFIIEGVAFGGMILLILLSISKGGEFVTLIPVLSLYAVVGYRLIPAFQNIYDCYLRIRFSSLVLDSIHKDLVNLRLANTFKNTETLPFHKTIKLSNVSFSYPNNNRKILKDASLTISANSKVAIFGSTGSGKTTLIDIILGLLDPIEGNLLIDGLEINDNNKKKWQKNIGYVPQQITLLDESVASNIAYGVKKEDIDFSAVKTAAKIANIHEFITKLPNQYETFVGEKGVRISGGERQRIGIARAFYHQPKLLVLDESTNSLDVETEQMVIKEILDLNYKITIITITHRINTIDKFDHIYKLKDGKLSEVEFDELNKTMK
jgi:ABC-type multidrug transport system fused ATPase/permease subunit